MIELFLLDKDLPSGAKVTPILALRPADWAAQSQKLSETQRNLAQAHQFEAKSDQILQLPNVDGHIERVLLGCGVDEKDDSREMRLGLLGAKLPDGFYQIEYLPSGLRPDLAAIGFGLGSYRFERYLSERCEPPTLVLSEEANLIEIRANVTATTLCRDLINTPASDMGPAALEQAVRDLAKANKVSVRSVVGEDLLEQNYPMIHAVGRAAHEPPRLVEFEWGDPSHPRLAVIGKGITFDTGGVNMKGASGARLMKKDMGGAAHALALSQMIMATGLPVRLHCLLAIAENAVSSNAYRPGDILSSRAGLTVEIDNTDAEGRLVLGDALARAAEDDPVLMIDFATLTGAARVALGPQLPPFFCNRDSPIEAICKQGLAQNDPVWSMPLWRPYKAMLSSPIASLKNAGGGFAGSVTAALFLEHFVDGRPWMHFDTYGWNPTARPAHPKGADMYGVRAVYYWLKAGGLNMRLT